MYGQFQQMYGKPDQLIRVNGYEGAKAYQMMMPNSTVALFDGGEDLMYIKSTDSAGFATIRTFKFEPYCQRPQNGSEYISKADLDELKNEVKDYVKQLISNESDGSETE